ncbi:MAG: hypothetical protein K9H61_12475 [Bacteroidia bacterium]|nr:hypothetical protein [Bacteroidia bacterium]MCF8428049.1 hypothetical protein [Bacteroidia bacterium]MCF8447800.1 hypothetical protein [Bacteroidia bacterium]
MKTKAELEKDILQITLKIYSEFPELSKYIDEMPDKSSGNEKDGMELKSYKAYSQSLQQLLKEYAKTHHPLKSKIEIMDNKFPGYPLYPASEDIYAKAKLERDLNPEDITKKKTPNEPEGTPNEKGFENHMSGDDLDIPEEGL